MTNVNATPAPATSMNAAALTAAQHRQSACRLRTIRVTNTAAGTRYLQLHDSTAVPADGAVPLVSIPLAAGAYYESDTPRDFINGLYACASTTQATKTLSAADFILDITFN